MSDDAAETRNLSISSAQVVTEDNFGALLDKHLSTAKTTTKSTSNSAPNYAQWSFYIIIFIFGFLSAIAMSAMSSNEVNHYRHSHPDKLYPCRELDGSAGQNDEPTKAVFNR